MFRNILYREERKPIGGEFSIGSFKTDETFEIWHSYLGPITQMGSGRDALRALLGMWPSRSIVFLSAFSCDAITTTLVSQCNLDLRLIDIGPNLYPDISIFRKELAEFGDRAIILVGNLYGTKYPNEIINFINEVRSLGIPVIEDRTHNLDLAPTIRSDAWFASARKWIPAPGLGIYSAPSPCSVPLRRFSSRIFYRYTAMRILGYVLLFPTIRNKLVAILRNSDSRLGSGRQLIGKAYFGSTKISANQFSAVLDIRRRNAKILAEYLISISQIEIINLSSSASSFSVTFRCLSYRDELREFLSARSIFAPILWPVPESYELLYPNTYSFSKSTLTIPLDQRYSVKETIFVATSIKEFYDKIT